MKKKNFYQAVTRIYPGRECIVRAIRAANRLGKVGCTVQVKMGYTYEGDKFWLELSYWRKGEKKSDGT